MKSCERNKLAAIAIHNYWNEVLKPQVGPNSNEADRETMNNYFKAYASMEKLSKENLELSSKPVKFTKGSWKELIRINGGK